jgi:hypothetical protein
MKILEGWWVTMVRGAQPLGPVSHLGLPSVQVREALPGPVLLVLGFGFVVVRFWVVTPRQVGAAVGLVQQLLVAVLRARLPTHLAIEDLMAASQWQTAAPGRRGEHRAAPERVRSLSWAPGRLSAPLLAFALTD